MTIVPLPSSVSPMRPTPSLLALALLLSGCSLLPALAGRAPTQTPPGNGSLASPPESAESPWAGLDAAAEEAVRAGQTPGVVLLVGRRGKVVYRKAFGNRSLRPEPQPMTPDTLFDLASLTKVVATTSAVMALVEEGKLRLEEPVARYWPEFGQNGKEGVTVRQLLTHSSGLAAWATYEKQFRDPAGSAVQDHTRQVLEAIAALPLRSAPDTKEVYSDLGFITLGELVRRVSGEPLDRYARRRIFEPLGMKETGYAPASPLRARAAPTTMRSGVPLQGEVHDPISGVTGGVAGHAGLFSTADDLARFARMLLSSDFPTRERFPLRPETVRLMTTRATPDALPARGLGWDLASPYSRVKGARMPLGSFGHTGYTGTFLWVDPYSDTFLIGLSNRVHPDEKGNVLPLWRRASDVVAGAVWPEPDLKGLLPRPVLAHRGRAVLTGLDVLRREGFSSLQGRTVGLLTNRTGQSCDRLSGIDLLRRAPGVKLAALFTPEHGLRSDVDRFVESSTDELTGLPVHSLYGQGKLKPTPEQLKGLDTLVFDIQDVGLRYYTYISTLGLAMEAAKENGLRFIVLDRPNPNGGKVVDGPLLDEKFRSFVAQYPLPVRHGMTVGELARLYNEEYGIGCDLQVVPMEGWRRGMRWEETGLPWINPSPNLRNPRQAELYAAIGLLEYANVSVGRGTETPFEHFGAPWIDGERLAADLNRRRLRGVSFAPVSFQPSSSVHAGQRCGGVSIQLTDRERWDSTRTAVEITDALARLYRDQVKLDRNARLWGTDRIVHAVQEGQPTSQIVAGYRGEAERFRRMRRPYLIYQ